MVCALKWRNSTVYLLMSLSVVWGQIPDGYYDTAEGLTGTELKSALHQIISNHTKYPYSSTSTDVWDILKASDEDPDNPENVILLYTGRSQEKSENSGESSATGSNRWNREHVWSKSHCFPDESDTAFTDCHHIRPADESVNSSRNTLDFDIGGDQHAEATECFYDEDSWEPRDAVKGDIARMMFYMTVRYDPGFHIDNSLYDLELVDSTGTHTYTPYFGKLSTLLLWHQLDPVDAFEEQRHEVVYDYQNNRNPFIDHPEWADSIFASQLSPYTRVGFTGSSATVDEDAGSITLELSIQNPHPDISTTCTVELVGGTGSSTDLEGFTSAEVVFPGGSAMVQTLDMGILDDEESESLETFILAIRNVAGGDSAQAANHDLFLLTINPSDQESAVSGLIISEVMDGNRSGGQPKFIEITNTALSTIDIGAFQIWRGTNGNEPENVLEILSGAILDAGDSWVVAYNSSGMEDAGFTVPDQTSGTINGNGNDVYELRTAEGELVDAFGLVGESNPWYENSYATRNPEIVNGSAGYSAGEWVLAELESGYPQNGSPGSPGLHDFIPPSGIENEHMLQPDRVRLSAFPNPFNGETTFSIIPSAAGELDSEINIYDIHGRLVSTIPPTHWGGNGPVRLRWQGGELASGIYFLCYKDPLQTLVLRFTILR